MPLTGRDLYNTVWEVIPADLVDESAIHVLVKIILLNEQVALIRQREMANLWHEVVKTLPDIWAKPWGKIDVFSAALPIG